MNYEEIEKIYKIYSENELVKKAFDEEFKDEFQMSNEDKTRTTVRLVRLTMAKYFPKVLPLSKNEYWVATKLILQMPNPYDTSDLRE